MMFGGMMREEQAEPSEADIGIFLNRPELMEWHKKMQQRYPQVFPADDKLFGSHPNQHPQGTKLMAYFDDDPQKPMRCEVLGSRWKMEFGDKSPVYIIRMKNSPELSQIELTSAHEGEHGWQVGWDIPPPSS